MVIYLNVFRRVQRMSQRHLLYFWRGMVELFASNLFIKAQTVANIAVYMLLQFSEFKWRIHI